MASQPVVNYYNITRLLDIRDSPIVGYADPDKAFILSSNKKELIITCGGLILVDLYGPLEKHRSLIRIFIDDNDFLLGYKLHVKVGQSVRIALCTTESDVIRQAYSSILVIMKVTIFT